MTNSVRVLSCLVREYMLFPRDGCWCLLICSSTALDVQVWSLSFNSYYSSWRVQIFFLTQINDYFTILINLIAASFLSFAKIASVRILFLFFFSLFIYCNIFQLFVKLLYLLSWFFKNYLFLQHHICCLLTSSKFALS